MVIYARSEANRKVQTDKPSNRNLKRKPRGAAELETGGRQLRVVPVTRIGGAEKGIAGKLSTGTGVERMGNQAGENGESEEDERNRSTPGNPL